jgi:anti-anti-sigma factor
MISLPLQVDIAIGSDVSLKPTVSHNQTYQIQLPPLFIAAAAMEVKQTVQQVCQKQQSLARIVLDFGQTTFMDSMGIGALVNCYKTAEQHQIELVLYRVPDPVKEILYRTELDQIFTIESCNFPETQENPKANGEKRGIDAHPSAHPSVNSKAKRAIDILGSLVGLGITGIILIPIAIAIRLEDGGPIFFSQTRCSWLGRRFRMWKFRSMVVDAEAQKHLVENKVQGALFKNPEDPRITRVGRFLRRTSLDEFPQFWNVFKGDMSLVGTRPPTPDELERYEIPQWQRLDIKPGITGEWQVNGRSTITNFEDVVKLDVKYQEQWSFWYDLKLIFRTVILLINKDSGAY